MADPFDYDVFLSYSSKDREVVHALAERLRDSSLRVWLDNWVIHPGDPIGIKIQHGLEKSRVLLMCMSKAYFASEWAGLEHHSLLFRDPTNKERRFIPVLIEDCDPPYTVAQFAYVDWREPSGEAYDKLLKACRPERSKRRQKSGRPRRSQRDPRRRQVVHTAEDRGQGVNSVAVTADGRRAVTGSRDRTLKVWDLEQGTLLATLEGHGDGITAVGVTGDGRRAVSGSFDQTLKVWDLEQGALLATLTDGEEIWSVALTADGQRAVSGASGHTLKIWDLPPHNVVVGPEETTRYTNAKVVLVGESGVGKTGLAMRLAENKWRETSSTHGMTVWPLALSPADDDRGAVMEREVWLWDFAGQPDYRLIHQLYMDETALALMVFDPQKEKPFEPLGHWEKAVARAVKHDPAKLLVAPGAIAAGS